ncbi:MAG: hypothetical protein H8E57_10010 [Candidatus Cloacimonetes bacterium]|nr:hypothetical protein [Candidatus Cloacimonadota bacterium]
MRKGKDCSKIEELLICKNFSEINQFEEEYILKHTSNCESCKKILTSIRNFGILQSDDLFLEPAGSVKADIIQKMVKERANLRMFFEKIRSKIYDLLNFKIPVYQFLIGLFLIILVMNLNNIFQNRTFSESDLLLEKNYKQYNISDELEQIKYNIGRNMKEDSLLFKGFVTTAESIVG